MRATQTTVHKTLSLTTTQSRFLIPIFHSLLQAHLLAPLYPHSLYTNCTQFIAMGIYKEAEDPWVYRTDKGKKPVPSQLTFAQTRKNLQVFFACIFLALGVTGYALYSLYQYFK